MSTRGLWGFIHQGEYTANYNHSDSYPDGLGLEFWSACKEEEFDDYSIEEESIEFIKDSLFCEWAYFYDRDNKIFEIWKGYQKEPDLTNPFGQSTIFSGLYPCKRIFRGNIDYINREMFESDDFEKELIRLVRDNKIKTIIDKNK